jgi:hypothetical protein
VLLCDAGGLLLPELLSPAAEATCPGGGFVTISQNGRIVWQGDEENIPDRFLQQEFDLQSSRTGKWR